MASDQLEPLKAAFADVREENIRLRAARAAVTRQLGPLPISAAAIGGLVTAFPGRSAESGWHIPLIIAAAVGFLAMLIVSMRYSALTPYRRLRDDLEAQEPDRKDGAPRSPRTIAKAAAKARPRGEEAEWYAAMLDTEYAIRGTRPGEEASEPKKTNADGEASELSEASDRQPWLIRLLRPPQAKTLQHAFDLEWQGLFITQLLFAAGVILLIAARLS